MQIDAGLCLVTVLNKAEGLKVKSGNLGKAIACHRCPLVQCTASGEQNYLDIGYILKIGDGSYIISPMYKAILLMSASIPDEEVVLLTARHVVSSGSTKAVIQQYMETENRPVGQ